MASLTNLGHDVVSVRDRNPGAADDALLALAYEEERVLVTEDKDFGELVSFAASRTRASSASSRCGSSRRLRPCAN